METAKKTFRQRIEAHLVPDWRRWHKWASVRWAAALIAIIELQEHLPGVKDYLPEKYVKYMAIAIIIARLLRSRPSTTNPISEAPEKR